MSKDRHLAHMVFRRNQLPDPIRYNPHRDVAYGFAGLMIKAEDITLCEHWKDLQALIKEKKVCQTDLAEGWVALSQLMNLAAEDFEDPMQVQLEKTNWFEINPMARIAICAALGRIMLGACWQGIQETTTDEYNPCPLTDEQIAEAGARLARYMSWPLWFRRIWLWWHSS